MQTSNVNLPIQVTGRHVTVTEGMKEHAQKKIEGLHLDYPRIIEAQIILNVQKHRHIAEVILYCANHITIEASSETPDMYASIDQAVARIEGQMRKYKTRIMRQHRPRKGEVRHVDEHIFDVEAFAELEETQQPAPLQTEKHPIKPMYVDEAILQLEMSDRPFVIFEHAETHKLSILYRRKDNGMGLIEPVQVS